MWRLTAVTSRSAWSPGTSVPALGRALTCPAQALDRGGEALGARQQVVLEGGQPLGGGHLHADAVFLLGEARALAVQEELGGHRGRGSRGVRAQGAGRAANACCPIGGNDSAAPGTGTWKCPFILGLQPALKSSPTHSPSPAANSMALILRATGRRTRGGPGQHSLVGAENTRGRKAQ